MEHVRSRRSPKCARCRNHGFSVPLRGHAGRCRFARCACWKCALITERTRITARQREAGATGSGVTEPDGEEDTMYTELQVAVPVPEFPQNPAPAPSYTCTRARESARLREQPKVQWEYYIPQTPLSAVYSGDLPVAMPLPLHRHYAGALVSLGMPALGPYAPRRRWWDTDRKLQVSFTCRTSLTHTLISTSPASGSESTCLLYETDLTQD